MNVQAKQKSFLKSESIWLRIAIGWKSSRRWKQTASDLGQAVLGTTTHFPLKVSTVEFGVILSCLHRFVWKFPLLANRVRVMSQTGWGLVTATRDDVTGWRHSADAARTLDGGSVSFGLVISGNLRNSRGRMLAPLHSAEGHRWMCEPTLSVRRELCWGLRWCTLISVHGHSEGSLLFNYNGRKKWLTIPSEIKRAQHELNVWGSELNVMNSTLSLPSTGQQ